jgi:geranylgeranylglycerol-phosphate geranylgeranyltransferase
LELKSLIEITRPHNCLMGGLTCVIGVLAADRIYSLDLAHSLASSLLSNVGLRFPSRLIEIIVLTYLIYVFIAAAGNIVNDIYDIEVDRINKPNRPLPRKALTLSQAKAFTVILWFIGMALAFTISLISGIMAIIFAGLGYIYAARVKALGALGNFAVASSFSFGMFFGAIVATESKADFVFISGDTFVFIPLVIWMYFLTSTFVLFGREVIKGIEDLRGDKLRSVKTVARQHGSQTAAKVAALSNILGITFFGISWFIDGMMLIALPLVIVGSAVVLASAVIIFRRYRVPKAQGKASLLDKGGGLCGLAEFLLVNIVYALS